MENEKLATLKKYWGYDQFRPLQEDIIQSVLDGRDTLALMPTGGGKSICFQVPALMKPGICIVVTPLIALMKDQVAHLKAKKIEAVAIFSGLTKREVDITLDNCIFGHIKFLYLSPERLQSDLVRERIRHMKVNLYAIDEAHCISQWGYDFRPPYLLLSNLRELHPEIPYLALTASATPKVVLDIQEKLGFKHQNVFSQTFKRDNLAYMVLPEENKAERMLRIINKLGGSGIVYVRNRRETQEVALYLMNNGIPADFYHAGLANEMRDLKQLNWMNNKIRVIVATNAFGMGIDKPDVRFVIHLDLPDSLEAYYQEAGRAGRDHKKAFPVILYQQNDLDKLQENFLLSYPTIPHIKEIYHQLCNHFQVPYGAGEGMVVDFDIVTFCKKYQLNVLTALNAFKFLEFNGWISLSEANYIPSRLKIEVDHSELYKFQVKYEQFDKLIKLILRSYGGVFEYFASIREMDLAKALNKSYGFVVEALTKLQELEIVSYIPATDQPQLTFLVNRVDYKHLHIDQQYYTERKETQQAQLTAIQSYVHEKYCRSQAIQRYFGESNPGFCEVCDLCLIRNHGQKIEQKIRVEILETLRNHTASWSLTALVDHLQIGNDEQKLTVIRQMHDQDEVCTEEGLIRLL